MRVLDLIFRPKKSRLACYEEAASVIEAFVDGRSGKWDWDDFTSTKRRDDYLESVRDRCLRVYDDFPAEREGHYCSAEGIAVLRDIAHEVRARASQLHDEESA